MRMIKHALIRVKLLVSVNNEPTWIIPDEEPAWVIMVTSMEEMSGAFERQRQLRLEAAVKPELRKNNGFGLNEVGLNSADIGRLERSVKPTWEKILSNPDMMIMAWHNNSGFFPCSKAQTESIEILKIVSLPWPQMPTENTASEIIVCENSPTPEDWWTNHLMEKYEGSAVTVLTQFSERSKEQLAQFFKAASIISFTTSFSSYEWFETVLDVIIENNLTCRTIYGTNSGQNWLAAMPEHLLGKIKRVKDAENDFIVSQFTSQISAVANR